MTSLIFPADDLVERLVHNADIPSLGLAVSRVAQLADSSTSSLGDLANLILSDVQLTQKVLRLANSVIYRRFSAPVTTVSKAISRIGSEQVKLIALSSLLLEGMANKQKAAYLSGEFLQALFASTLASAVGPRIGADGEEAAVCAMFRNIGRLMVVVYETACFEEIRRVMAEDEVSEGEAAKRVTGVVLELVGQRILEHWGIPDTIVKSVAPYPSRAKPQGNVEKLQYVSEFASDVAAAMRKDAGPAREAALQRAVSAFGTPLGLDFHDITELTVTTAERTRQFATALDLEGAYSAPAAPAAAAAVVGDASAELPGMLPTAEAGTTAAVGRATWGGKPANSTALLLAGIQDMTTGLAEGQDTGNVLNMALETLYRGLGYHRAVLCLRDASSNRLRARLTFGQMTKSEVQHFSFSTTPTTDLFWSAMQRNVDVHIRDLAEANIQANLPTWFHQACHNARSFVLLPIIFKHKPLGFFYGDRTTIDEVGLTAEELALMRMLRGQTLVALRSAMVG